MSDGSKERTKITKNITAGLDLGDRYTYLCLLDTDSGEVLEEGKVRTTPEGIARRFDSAEPMRIALEVGTRSPWVSRLLKEFGDEVVVANPRRTRLIYGEGRKTDKIDAEKLARLAWTDIELGLIRYGGQIRVSEDKVCRRESERCRDQLHDTHQNSEQRLSG